MITDKQAQIAVDTIIKYCQERYESYHNCKGCAIQSFCDELYMRISDDWDGWTDLRDYPVFYNEKE